MIPEVLYFDAPVRPEATVFQQIELTIQFPIWIGWEFIDGEGHVKAVFLHECEAHAWLRYAPSGSVIVQDCAETAGSPEFETGTIVAMQGVTVEPLPNPIPQRHEAARVA